MVKLILVEVKNADPTDFELNIRNTVVLDGTKRTVKGVESSSDYERIRDGKAGVLTGCDFGGQAFAQPLRIAFNGGHAHEDGAQTFGVCVRDDSVDVQVSRAQHRPCGSHPPCDLPPSHAHAHEAHAHTHTHTHTHMHIYTRTHILTHTFFLPLPSLPSPSYSVAFACSVGRTCVT